MPTSAASLASAKWTVRLSDRAVRRPADDPSEGAAYRCGRMGGAADPCARCYHERQVSKQCVMHAANAFLGGHVLTCAALEAFAEADPFLRALPGVRSAAAGVGNFSPSVFSRWLVRHRGFDLRSIVFKGSRVLAADASDADIRSALNSTRSTRVYATVPGHAFVLRRPCRDRRDRDRALGRRTRNWCLIDSFLPGPARLGTLAAPWSRLRRATLYVAERARPPPPRPVAPPPVIDLDD